MCPSLLRTRIWLQKEDTKGGNVQLKTARFTYSYIKSQLALESEAREIMPYSFDECTNPLGPLRQPVFSCKTCQSTTTSSPKFPDMVDSGAAAICYSCSISCHGDHELVEIFNKRDVVCDCGTDRMPRGSSCALRKVAGEKAREGNRYCHNYWGRFCACDADYDPESEKGTMYQCLLGDACGEDWFHDGCIVGEKRAKNEEVVGKPAAEAEDGVAVKEAAVPATEAGNGEAIGEGADTAANQNGEAKNADKEDGGESKAGNVGEEEEEEEERPNGFPDEESFDAFICWLCVEKNPWLKRYAGTPGFLEAVHKKDAPPPKDETDWVIVDKASPNRETNAPEPETSTSNQNNKKRKVDDEEDLESTKPDAKRARTPDAAATLSSELLTTEQTPPANQKDPSNPAAPTCTYELLPAPPLTTTPFSIFLTHTFRASLCHCPLHAPLLNAHPVLLEEEDTYEPPLDDVSNAGSGDNASVHSGGSLFERGERALGMVDRVKAIEGVMAYNDLKEKVKGFLKPFADSGEAVGVEDVKRYFAELRGDVPAKGGKDGGGGVGDGRREQSGEFLQSLCEDRVAN